MPNPTITPQWRCTKCGKFLFLRDLKYAKGYGHTHELRDGSVCGPVKERDTGKVTA